MEVAAGADTTARNEAEEFVERLNNRDGLMGTSCCPAYTEAVKKHAPDFQRFVSHTRTPMSYTAELAAEHYPDAVKVFIGPCIAKKFEGIHDENVDYVLTYEELGAFFMARDIDTASLEESTFDATTATRHGRGFPVSQGVAEAVKHYVGQRAAVQPVLIDGLKKKGLNQLKLFARGKAPGNLIEVMSCEGGCICGPGVVSNPKATVRALKAYLDADAKTKAGGRRP
jgi:iron only hydrogenase large subunit-like protein